jgi:hypothetical protein
MLDEGTYIDTSVLGAYYCPEPLSMNAETASRRIKIPVISVLSEVEFTSLISRKRRSTTKAWLFCLSEVQRLCDLCKSSVNCEMS